MRSLEEIKNTLMRYGADGFGYMETPQGAGIVFKLRNREYSIQIGLPSIDQFQTTSTGRRRTENIIQQEFEKAVRQKWRALALVVKAKLEAVESGISTVEQEFLAFTVLPDGQQFGDWAQKRLDEDFSDIGNSIQLLLPGSEND